MSPAVASSTDELALPPQLRLLALLTITQGLIMLAYGAADLLLAVADGSPEWSAVWFVVCGLGVWGIALLWVAHGLRKRRRWAFTPVVFTQLMLGVLAISFIGAATTPAKVVWGLLFIFGVVVLRLAFSREVREALITAGPPAAD